MRNIIIPRKAGGFFRLIKKTLPVLAFIFFTSCEEPDEIGLDFIDDSVSITAYDFPVTGYSILEDSVPTNYSNRNMLGFRNDQDQVFGAKKTSIYTEFRLPDNNLDLGDNPELDSVFLVLYYSGYYGDYTTHQQVRIFELSENFPETDDDAIYSTLTLDHKEIPIADTLVRPDPKGEYLNDEEDSPYLRIRLDKEFGEKLVEQSGQEPFEDNSSFLEFFKGLYITVEDLESDEEGAILFFNMLGSGQFEQNSSIQLYYKHESEDEMVSTTRSFFVSEFSKRSTHIENFDYENAHEHLKKQVIENDTTYGDSLLFLESLAGVNIFIDFPHDSINELADKNATINMAELIIPVDENFDSDNYYSEDTPIPGDIYLLKKDEKGELSHIEDSYYGYFGGSYDEDKKHYTINITQHFQEIVEDLDSNFGMVLVISESYNNAYRVVLNGSGRTDNPLRLKLKYTILD